MNLTPLQVGEGCIGLMPSLAYLKANYQVSQNIGRTAFLELTPGSVVSYTCDGSSWAPAAAFAVDGTGVVVGFKNPDGTTLPLGGGGGVTAFSGLTDKASVDLPAVNTPLADALATKATALAPVTLTTNTTLTRAAHYNRLIIVNAAGAVTLTATGTDALVGDFISVDVTGGGSVNLSNVTPQTGYTLFAKSGNTVEATCSAAGSFVAITPARYPLSSLQSDINIHGARLAEPLKTLDLPSPYFLNATTAKKEHAYGTPLYFENGFNGWKFWMVGAPYPTTESLALASFKYENPCIYVSNDGETWVTPTGLTNPIATSIGNADVNSYYADPYLAVDASGTKLYVIWLWTGRTGATKSSLMVSESTDGIAWTAPTAIYNSTTTAFETNSPSLFWNGAGWTVIMFETGTAFNIQYMTTASATPYAGWSAFTVSSAVHPLGRNWWHGHFVTIGNGTVIGIAVDNSSAGGSAYTMKSTNGGATWSVQLFTYTRTSTAGGSFYRGSLCVMARGVWTQVVLYISRIGPLYGAGFWVQKALLALDAATEIGTRESLRDMVNRKVSAGTVNTLRRSLLAWDSFQRADTAVSLGNLDGAPAGVTTWNAAIGTWGISTNRAYNVTTGNNIATVDLKSSDYDFEYQIAVLGTELNTVFGFIDSSNFYRVRSNSLVERIIGGGVDKSYGVLSNFVPIAGDVMRIRKEGSFATIYCNDRPVDTIVLLDANDAALKSSKIVGLQASGASASYVVNFMARIPS